MGEWRARFAAVFGIATVLAALGASSETAGLERVRYTKDGQAVVRVQPREALERFRPVGLLRVALKRGTPVAYDVRVDDLGGARLLALYARVAGSDGGDEQRTRDVVLRYFDGSTSGRTTVPEDTELVMVKAVDRGTNRDLDLTYTVRTGDVALRVQPGEVRTTKQEGRFPRFAPIDVTSFPAQAGERVAYTVKVEGRSAGNLGLYWRPRDGGDVLLETFTTEVRGAFVADGDVDALLVKPVDRGTGRSVTVTLTATLAGKAEDDRGPLRIRQRDPRSTFATFAPFASLRRTWDAGTAVTYDITVADNGGARLFALYGRPRDGGEDTLIRYFTTSSSGTFDAPVDLAGLRIKIVEGRGDRTLDVTLSVPKDNGP